jgi:membrane-associated phospholipid phosphatase
LCRFRFLGAVLAVCCTIAGPARADEPPTNGAVSAQSQSQDPLAPLAQIPPVPNPSPVVLGGKPTNPDRVGKPLEWRWSRFTTLDLIVTGVGGAVTLATAIIPPRATHVSGGVLFDDAIRSALRAEGSQTRYIFRDASDVGLSLMVTWPFFADSLMSAWWYRGSRDVAEQMALINLQALAVSASIQGVTNVLVSRERPYGGDCGTAELPSNAIDCTSTRHYRSFFSGHSALSFTSAALICMDHIEHELLGEPWDTLSCAGGYAVAATTATFRVVGDMHYATDVLTGALAGTLIGYGIPLLHYSHVNVGTVQTGGVRMQIVPSGIGAGLVGTF